MTGPEHYQQAEDQLALASGTASAEERHLVLLRAQVHATLALTAATAMNDAEGGMGTRDWETWLDTVSVSRPSGGTS